MLSAINYLKEKTNKIHEEVLLLKHTPSYATVLQGNTPNTHSAPQTPQNSTTNIRWTSKPQQQQKQQEIPVIISSSTPSTNSSLKRPHSRQNNTLRQIPQEHLRKSVLLMGDSIVQRMHPKGLESYVHRHAVPGAKIQTLLNDIHLFNLKQFETIIIYIGGNDLSATTDLELLEEKYDQLIATIKSSNSQAKIVLLQLAPRGDVDVTSMNIIIQRLSAHHKTDNIDIFQAFHDHNDRIIMRFMGVNDHIHPSPSGIKRILGTIHNIIPIVADFNQCVTIPWNQRNTSDTGNSHQKAGYQTKRNHPQKCTKCNETNHFTIDCRHKNPLKCWSCGLIGHKQENCWNMSF
jgi:hypothetical protein